MYRVLLCVDDRPQRLEIRKKNLERLGFSVVTATSVPTAVAALKRTEVTAVLLDCSNEGLDPEGSAFQVKRQLPEKPMLLVSAYSDCPERVHWLADEHVIRSERIERLMEVVEEATQDPYYAAAA